MIAALLAGCGEPPAAASKSAAPEVPVVIARPAPAAVTVTLPARLEAFRQAEVRARVAGIVTERLYQEGQEVKKGTPLFKIDPAPLQAARDEAVAALARANAMHATARDKLDRQAALLQSHVVSERDYNETVSIERAASAEVTAAKAALRRAELELGYATVTAPIDGRARRALVTEGALVGQDAPTPLTIVEQLEPIYANFAQPASELFALRAAISAGKLEHIQQPSVAVRLLRPDGSVYAHAGVLSFSDLAVDPGTDTVAMRAIFPNPDRELLPGAYMRVSFDSAINAVAIMIPRDALLRTASGAKVHVVDSQGIVRSRAVTANAMSEGRWIVESGLTAGERVIAQGAAALEPGTRVTPVERAL